jgi:hypothetical protein
MEELDPGIAALALEEALCGYSNISWRVEQNRFTVDCGRRKCALEILAPETTQDRAKTVFSIIL